MRSGSPSSPLHLHPQENRMVISAISLSLSLCKFAQGLVGVIRHCFRSRRSMARPKHCYLPHRSHLGLEMATRTCPGAAGVSGRAVWACFGVARTLEMSVRDPPKQCYLPHWSHLALEMAGRACLGAAGLSGRVVWACFGVARALKMAAQSRQCNHLALEMVAWARPGSGGAPSRAVWACFGVARALKMAAQSRQ